MTIIQTVNESAFVAAFDDMNRSDNFSVAARRTLFNYLEDISADLEEDYELDVIELCCDWAEHTTAELQDEYSDITDSLDEPWDGEQWLDHLLDYTQVLRVEHYGEDDTYLVLAF